MLETSEILKSEKYLNHATELRLQTEKASSKMTIAGLDNMTTRIRFGPAVEMMLFTGLEKVITPWRICTGCYRKYSIET